MCLNMKTEAMASQGIPGSLCPMTSEQMLAEREGRAWLVVSKTLKSVAQLSLHDSRDIQACFPSKEIGNPVPETLIFAEPESLPSHSFKLNNSSLIIKY